MSCFLTESNDTQCCNADEKSSYLFLREWTGTNRQNFWLKT